MRINKATRQKWAQAEMSIQLAFISWMNRIMNDAAIEQLKKPLPICLMVERGMFKPI